MAAPTSPERRRVGLPPLVRRARLWAVALVVFMGPGDAASGWTAEGHRRLSTAALALLAGTAIRFDSADLRAIVDASVQPDLMRPRALIQLHDREAPEHYLDLERLAGRSLPPTRSGLVALAITVRGSAASKNRLDWSLAEVGTLPYAVVEGTQRLAVMFAQLRRRPEDPFLRSTTTYLAGVMAHYAQDLHQPLHTTIHHDGRALDDGRSPNSGIHRLADDLLALVPDPAPPLIGSTGPDRHRLFAAVVGELMASHALVDRVYALEPQLRSYDHSGRAEAELEEFAVERYRSAARLTAELFVTAWQLAGELDLPAR